MTLFSMDEARTIMIWDLEYAALRYTRMLHDPSYHSQVCFWYAVSCNMILQHI